MGDPNQLFYLRRHVAHARGPVLEIGSKDYGSTVDFRALYPDADYVGLDLAAGKNVDVVHDLTTGRGPLPPGHFELAICCSVLEHVNRPFDFARHVTSVIRPGGALYVSVPWVWRFHAYPDDFFRYSWRGIETLFPDFDWSARYYSTNVEDEFISIDECPDADNRLAVMQATENGQRKHLAYLMVNMLGRKRADPGPEVRGDQPLWDAYLTWFYDRQVWKHMTWHGIRTLKLPSDLWNYQEIIHAHRVDWVVEAGTRHGGSALFFAQALASRQAKGRVVSIDIDAAARQVEHHAGIDFLIGDSGSQEMVDRVNRMTGPDRGPVFLILDSDHTCAHVLRELTVWVPFLRRGDYLVVEDASVNGHPVRPDFGPGPYEAVEQYLAACPGLLQHDAARERKFGATQAPMGHFIKL